MTDLRKAAEMALDALHNIDQSNNYDAIQALRQALSQPERYDQTALELCEKCGWKTVIPDEGCLNCNRQQEQEPEWIDDDFGTMWQKCGKKDCGKFVVKIGKVDCWNGDCPEAKEKT